MARTTKPLTAKEIDAAKPREKEYKLFDGGGLYMTVTSDGGKRWRLKYLIKGKEKRISLGVYPETTLSEARAKREQYKSDIAKGIDPSVVRKETKQARQAEERESHNTFRRCASDYFELIRPKISEGHYAKQWQRLEANLLPFIGNKRINEIRRDEILKCLTRIQERGAIEEAHRNYNIVSQIYQYATANDRCERNIAADISTKWTLKPVVSKNFPTITDPKEIGKLSRAIDGYQGEYSVRCALQIMPYVALRPQNIREMEWSQIDLEQGVLTIPAEKMKMKREHMVPLASQVVEILRELRGLTGEGRYVFATSRYRSSPLSNNTLNASLVRLGYSNEEIVPHGFRAMFSTIANEKRHADEKIIEKCLAHEPKNKVGAAYNRAEYWEQRVKLMQWWADFLDGVKNND